MSETECLSNHMAFFFPKTVTNVLVKPTWHFKELTSPEVSDKCTQIKRQLLSIQIPAVILAPYFIHTAPRMWESGSQEDGPRAGFTDLLYWVTLASMAVLPVEFCLERDPTLLGASCGLLMLVREKESP